MTDRDTITLPREVVKFVLQHLEWWSDDEPQEKEAIEALRTALAAEQPKQEAKQEPVAWQCREHGDDEWFDCSKEAYGINPSRYVYRRLYTAPPALAAEQPKPSEDIEALRRDAERYKWLKAKVEDYDGHACFPQVPYPAPIPDRSPFDAVDAAIDAAMKEGT